MKEMVRMNGLFIPCKREPRIPWNSGVKFLAFWGFLLKQKNQEKARKR